MAELEKNVFMGEDGVRQMPHDELEPPEPKWVKPGEQHLLDDLTPEELGPAPDEWATGYYGKGSRQEATDAVFNKLKTGEKLDQRDFIMAELALADAKKEAGIVDDTPPKGLFGLVWRYTNWKENRVRHRVKKKTYIWLLVLLGWMGGHRWYAKRYGLGVLYTGFFWSGVPFLMCFLDLLEVIPVKADEEGCIMM